ncbi:MAG TPA: hypothetical protein VHU88_10170 [Sporichthyaceae bacterium]|jgi:hypothetical protein|nr:hypothetical protein [Sporichthyaceae bacterium]
MAELLLAVVGDALTAALAALALEVLRRAVRALAHPARPCEIN